jgi:Amt family ammonium transporter
MRKKLGIAALLTATAALLVPAGASADVAEDLAARTSELNMVWVAVACVLVFLMQAGFMFLEIGFSRQKNAGTGVAKVLVNFAIVTIAWWAVGYGIAEGGNGEEGLPGSKILGGSGFLVHFA